MPTDVTQLNERNRDRGLERAKNQSYKMYPGDIKLVEYIADYLGSSKSDAFRTAVRAYAFHIQSIRGKQDG